MAKKSIVLILPMEKKSILLILLMENYEKKSQSIEDVKKAKIAICITKGHLITRSKGITRIFGDYAFSEDKKDIAEVGNTTLIPNGCIIDLKYISTKK